MNLHKIHCGVLPLSNRFIACSFGETVWAIPASVALDMACRYYEREGWYEDCELEEDPSLEQLHGDELRNCIEINGDLEIQVKEARWSRVKRRALLVAGRGDIPPHNDQLWWFQENGSVDELTDLPIEQQNPQCLIWFDDEYRVLNKIDVGNTSAPRRTET